LELAIAGSNNARKLACSGRRWTFDRDGARRCDSLVKGMFRKKKVAPAPAERGAKEYVFRECAPGYVETPSILMTGLQLAWLQWVAQYGSQTE